MFSNISDYTYIRSWKQVLVGWWNFCVVTLEMGLQFNSVDGRFLRERDLIFIVYISVCEGLNKDSIAQWIFCRLVGSRKEGTSLQVLEASQGGLHPAIGVRC